MLLAFRVSNYRSILDEQELSLVRTAKSAAGGGATADPTTVAAIYGANASGKSNLFAAMKFMREAVADSHATWDNDDEIPVEPFLLDKHSANAPSKFEIDFKWLDVRYRYGFELNKREVLSEWLHAFPKGRRQTLFERDRSATEEYYFGKNLGGRNRVIAELTRNNALFISTAAASRHELLQALAHWFRSHLRMADATDENSRLIFTAKEIFEKPQSAKAVSALLKSADLGICDLDVQERERDSVDSSSIRAGEDKMRRNERRRRTNVFTGNYVVQLKHRGDTDSNKVGFPLESESLGTRSLLSLAGPIMLVLRTQSVLFVDEIDRSLHPRLVSEIIRLFQDPDVNQRGAQLVFTSHDTSFLGGMVTDRPLLERDQVWFTEKDVTGSTHLYPLTDFSPRRLENLERGYLQGRYGGVPVLESLTVRDVLMNHDTTEVLDHFHE